MAKRKRLNKRVIIVLIVVGCIVIGGGGVALFLNSLPKDPQVYLKKGDDALAKGDYRGAQRAYGIAMNAAEAGDKAPYYLKMAKAMLEWVSKPFEVTGLSRTERSDRHRYAIELVRKAMQIKPDFEEAQQILCDMSWAAARRYQRWTDYIAEADKMLRIVPDDHATYFKRGLAKSEMAKAVRGELVDEAIVDLRKAIDLKKDEITYWMGLINFYRSIDQDEQASKVFSEALAENPDSADLRVQYASYLRKGRDKGLVMEQLRQAVEREPSNIIGLLAMADVYSTQKKFDEAIKALISAKAVDDSDYRIYQALAAVYKYMKQKDKALAAIEEGLAAVDRRRAELSGDEESTKIDRRLKQASWQLHYLLANALLDTVAAGTGDKEKMLERARQSLTQISKLAPEGPHRAKILGRIALAEGNTSEAIKLLEEAFESFRGFDQDTANLLIRLYVNRKLYGRAEKIIDRLLNLPGQSRNPRAQLAKARLEIGYRAYEKAMRRVALVRKGHPEDAEAKKLEVILNALMSGEARVPTKMEELVPQTIRILLSRAEQLWIDGRQGEAVRLVEDLYGRKPENMQVITALLTFYLADKKLDKAKALLQQAMKALPEHEKSMQRQLKLIGARDSEERFQLRMQMAEDNPVPLNRALEKATICAITGRKEQHYQYLQEAAKIDPNAPAVVDRMLRYAIFAKDWPLAEKWLEKAREVDLDSTGGKLSTARVAMAREEYSQAIPLLKELSEQRGELKNVLVMLAQCYLATDDLDNAEQTYARAVQNDPGYAPAVVGMARIMELQGKRVEFNDWIRRAHRIVPRNLYVRERYLEIQELEAAPAEIAEIIAQREYMLGQRPKDMRNRIRLAVLYDRNGQVSNAGQMYRYIYQNSPNKISTARMLVGFYARTNESGKAEELLTRLLASSKDKVGAFVLYGDFLVGRNAFDQAHNAFDKAVAADPKDVRGHEALAGFFAGRRQWKQAADVYQELLSLKPKDMRYKRSLARYRLEAGDLDKGAAIVDEILAENPEDAEAMTLKGMTAMKRGDLSKAEELLDLAVEANPNYVESLVYRSRLYLAQGLAERARDDLKQARQFSAGNLQIAMELGRVYESLRDYDNARLVYREILDIQGGYRPAIGKLIRLYMEHRRWRRLEALLDQARKAYPADISYWLAEARMWKIRADNGKRIAALKSAVGIAPNAPIALRAYFAALQEDRQYDKVLSESDRLKGEPGYAHWINAVRARALVGAGKPAEAEALFISALKDAPGQGLGFVVSQIKGAYGIAQSIEKLKGWMQARPSDWRLHSILGELYLQASIKGRLDETAKAVELLHKARKLTEDKREQALIDLRLGTAYYKLRDFSKAERAYLAVLEVFENHPSALNNLAYLYVDDMDQPAKALPYAQKAARMLPENPNVLDTYGWILARLGEHEEAARVLMRCIQMEESLSASRYHLGWVYEQTARISEAEKQYRLGFEMIRDNEKDPLYKMFSDALSRVRGKMESKEH